MKITTPGWTQAQGVGCFFLARRTHSRALRSSLSHAVKTTKKKKKKKKKREVNKQPTNNNNKKKDKEKLPWAGYMNNGNFSTFFIIFFHLREKARFTASEH